MAAGWSITKGAAEVIIGAASSEFYGDVAAPLDAARLRHIAEQMAAEGLRVLAIGVRHWAELPVNIEPSVAREQTAVCRSCWACSIRHALRLPMAIADCHTAGITPVMITGDHPLTARAVAARSGARCS